MSSLWSESRWAKTPLVVMSFDDGNLTDYTVAYPFMKSRGIVGTSYLVTNYVGRLLDNYMSWDQVREMAADGWDMQCHTHNHVDLTQLTETELHEQMQLVNRQFARHGLALPDHHAYPFGLENALVRSVVGQYRKTARGTVQEIETYGGFERLDLMGLHGDISTEAKLNTFKGHINAAIANHEIAFVYWHRLTPERIPFFEEFIDYALMQGVRFITHAQLYYVLYYHQRKLNFLSA